MAVRVNGSEIVLTGMVGAAWWDEDGFTSGDVILALAQVGAGNPVKIRLNSGGGIATEGAAIHAALKGHGAPIEITVEGIAASAASLIAMAGTKTIMTLGSVMMIHDPATITWGTAADHEKAIEYLNALAGSYAAVYAAKTGGTADDMRAKMKSELWMTAEEAVAQGFADAAEGAANSNDPPAEPTAFAYGVYAHAPPALRALANAKGWKPLGSPQAATTAAPRQPQEHPMTVAPTAVTMTADETKARIKAIMTSPEAAGRSALAEKLAYDTDMAPEAAIAMLSVAGKEDATADTESFADRKARLEDDGLGAPGVRPSAVAEKAEKAKAGWGVAVARYNKGVRAA